MCGDYGEVLLDCGIVRFLDLASVFDSGCQR